MVISLVSPVVSTWNQTTCVMQELTLPCLQINVDTFLPTLKHRKETKLFSVNLGMHLNWLLTAHDVKIKPVATVDFVNTVKSHTVVELNTRLFLLCARPRVINVKKRI